MVYQLSWILSNYLQKKKKKKKKKKNEYKFGKHSNNENKN